MKMEPSGQYKDRARTVENSNIHKEFKILLLVDSRFVPLKQKRRKSHSALKIYEIFNLEGVW